jgi:dihydrofolate synthase/folylpolyglutamate synthase
MADTIITITPNNLRALSSEILAREARVYCDRVIDGRSVDQALNLAYDLANKEDVIIGFGSLSFLKDIYNSLKIIRTKKN